MKSNDVVTIVDGNYRLTSPEYIFIKVGKRAKIIKRRLQRTYDKPFYCSGCRVLPAIQLDRLYEQGIHDFTLCSVCLAEDEAYLRNSNKEDRKDGSEG